MAQVTSPTLSRAQESEHWSTLARLGLVRSIEFLGTAIGYIFGAFLALSLATYVMSDPSINTVSSAVEGNWGGIPGAYLADLSLTIFGIASWLLIPICFIFANRLWRNLLLIGWLRRVSIALLSLFIIGASFALWFTQDDTDLPAGRSGIIGMLLAKLIHAGIAKVPETWQFGLIYASGPLFFFGGLYIWTRALNIHPMAYIKSLITNKDKRTTSSNRQSPLIMINEEEDIVRKTQYTSLFKAPFTRVGVMAGALWRKLTRQANASPGPKHTRSGKHTP